MAMFGTGSKELHKEEENNLQANSQTLIGKGAYFVGDMQIYGTLRLDGEMSGSITSKSRVVLGDSSKLKGNLLAQNAEISGEVEGKVEIVETLTLKASAVIKGDIACNKLIVEPGATFNGSCDMSQPIKEIRIGADTKGVSPKATTTAISNDSKANASTTK